MLIAVNYCYNPGNHKKNKIKLLKDICNKEVFAKALEGCNYNNISLTRKITIWTLKNKFYFLTDDICRIRQIQNSKKC